MQRDAYRTGRRAFLGSLAAGASFFTVPGLFAEELTRTPAQTEGPFYPDHLPLDQDNDLLILGKSLTPAVGTITQLSGRVLGPTGQPIKGAVVEIWQVDGGGIYLHSACPNHEKLDKNFQGFGKFETGSTGEYRFRTVKPVPYPGRTPHIHFKIKKGDKELLCSQCYIKGEPLNERDGVFRAIRDPKERESVLVAFTPIPGSKTGEVAAKFDIILGLTPAM